MHESNTTSRFGGKDNFYNMMKCVNDGHKIEALAHLKPKKDGDISYMNQSVYGGFDLYSVLMGVPWLPYRGNESRAANSTSENQLEEDDFDGLQPLIQNAKNVLEIQAVSVCETVPDQELNQVKQICEDLNLMMLTYSGPGDQMELLKKMIAFKISAIVINVSSKGLQPKKHLGMTLEDLYYDFLCLTRLSGHDINEEVYEIFVLDCPLFKKKVIVEKEEVIETTEAAPFQTGYLKLKKITSRCKTVNVENRNITQLQNLNIRKVENVRKKIVDSEDDDDVEKAKRFFKKLGKVALYTVGGSAAVLGGIGLIVPALGFTAGGVAAGSMAAAYQSAVLGGTIASGSTFAVLQSVGAAGLAASTQAGVVAATAATSAAGVFLKKPETKK